MTEPLEDDFDAAHADPSIDTWSSASRQHYIDTGRYHPDYDEEWRQ